MSGEDSNDHMARISSISHCHAMMLQLIASKSTGLHSIEGTAVLLLVVAMGFFRGASIGIGVLW